MRYVITRDHAVDPIFDDLFDDWNTVSRKIPPVDVYETNGAYVLEAELPGYDEQALDMHIDHHVLHLISHQQVEKNTNGVKYLVRERSMPSFERSFSLPENVKEDGVSATFKDGVLMITLPKAQPVAPERITVAINK